MRLFSCSQVTLFRDCQRAWAFKYIAKIQTEQNESAKLGDEIEKLQLQPYLLEGKPFDFSRPSGEMAAKLLPYLPQPKTPGMVLQKHFVIPSPTWRNGEHVGFGFQGYVDLWLPDSALAPDLPGGAPFVGDFKSRGDLKWALDEKQLAIDVQANLYSFAAMYVTGARAVDCSWMFTQTKNARKAKRTYLRLVADQVAENFAKINDTALEMQGIRDASPNPLDLPPNPNMCRAYGGCPHQARCNLGPVEITAALSAHAERLNALIIPGETTMTQSANASDFKARLAARKAAQTGAQPTATPPATAQAPSTPLAPQSAPPSAVPTPSVPTAAEPAPVALPAWMTAPVDPGPGKLVVGINPPESALPPAPSTGLAAPATAAPAEASKRRGRPPKAAQEAQTPAPAVTTPASVPVETRAVAAEVSTPMSRADAGEVFEAMANAYDLIACGFAKLAVATRDYGRGK